MFTTPGDFAAANLSLWGFLYIPTRCSDGTVAQCDLNIYFAGCGSGGVGENSEKMVTVFDGNYGWGPFAHANDVIMLAPGRRDNCWNMWWDLFGI
jgi:hypothetical protein